MLETRELSTFDEVNLFFDNAADRLELDEGRLGWLRAERVRWKLICARVGVGRTTAWHRWSRALTKIAAPLNCRVERRRAGSRARQPMKSVRYLLG